MHRELKGIIERLASDYNNLKEEFLCCSGPVYCAYENATDTFIYHVVEFINGNMQKIDFFMYVLSSYKELEEISVDKESKKSLTLPLSLMI
ncbi:Uncharacterised protein [Serratia quinivorans]|nr:Uncharacterised protein [Serratia quinivorans]